MNGFLQKHWQRLVTISLLAVLAGVAWYRSTSKHVRTFTEPMTVSENKPEQPPIIVITNQVVIQLPLPGIDYNRLERDYPIAFLVMKGNKFVKLQRDLRRNDVDFAGAVLIRRSQEFVRVQINCERLNFPVRHVVSKNYMMRGGLTNVIGAKVRLPTMSATGIPDLYFEIIDNHAFEPIYVLGATAPSGN